MSTYQLHRNPSHATPLDGTRPNKSFGNLIERYMTAYRILGNIINAPEGNKTTYCYRRESEDNPLKRMDIEESSVLDIIIEHMFSTYSFQQEVKKDIAEKTRRIADTHTLMISGKWEKNGHPVLTITWEGSQQETVSYTSPSSHTSLSTETSEGIVWAVRILRNTNPDDCVIIHNLLEYSVIATYRITAAILASVNVHDFNADTIWHQMSYRTRKAFLHIVRAISQHNSISVERKGKNADLTEIKAYMHNTSSDSIDGSVIGKGVYTFGYEGDIVDTYGQINPLISCSPGGRPTMNFDGRVVDTAFELKRFVGFWTNYITSEVFDELCKHLGIDFGQTASPRNLYYVVSKVINGVRYFCAYNHHGSPFGTMQPMHFPKIAAPSANQASESESSQNGADEMQFVEYPIDNSSDVLYVLERHIQLGTKGPIEMTYRFAQAVSLSLYVFTASALVMAGGSNSWYGKRVAQMGGRGALYSALSNKINARFLEHVQSDEIKNVTALKMCFQNLETDEPVIYLEINNTMIGLI